MTRLNVLRIDASARGSNSESRALASTALDRLSAFHRLDVRERDLRTPLPHIDEAWIGASFTPPGERTAQQQKTLALSEMLIDEIEQSDLLLLSTPVYNFSVPAALKAWIDLVARAGRTFRYTNSGPEGLLHDKRVLVTITSGGTPIGSDIDFAGRYLSHVLGFIGLDDMTVIAADQRNVDPDAARQRAAVQIEEWIGNFGVPAATYPRQPTPERALAEVQHD